VKAADVASHFLIFLCWNQNL